MIFTSKEKNYSIVLLPQKSDRDGNIQQEAIRAIFKDKVFKTDDLAIIEKMKKNKGFNLKYFEVDEKGIPKVESRFGVSVMENKGQAVPDTKYDELKKEVKGISDTVNKLAEIILAREQVVVSGTSIEPKKHWKTLEKEAREAENK
jgi:hypothetical protein